MVSVTTALRGRMATAASSSPSRRGTRMRSRPDARTLPPAGPGRLTTRTAMISPDRPDRCSRRFASRAANRGADGLPFHRGWGGGPRKAGHPPTEEDVIGAIRDLGTLPQPATESSTPGHLVPRGDRTGGAAPQGSEARVALLRERRFKAFRDEMFVTNGREVPAARRRTEGEPSPTAHRADAEPRVGDRAAAESHWPPAQAPGSRTRWRSGALSDFGAWPTSCCGSIRSSGGPCSRAACSPSTTTPWRRRTATSPAARSSSTPGRSRSWPSTARGGSLLVRQWRHAVGRALWEIPAGTLSRGEDPETAARRELAEETGYTAEVVGAARQPDRWRRATARRSSTSSPPAS